MHAVSRSMPFWIALLCLMCAGSSATTLIEPDLTDLVRRSEVVVIGEVSAIDGIESEDGLRTNVRVQVDQRLKGMADDTVTIVEPGGQVGTRQRWIAGAPTFFVGERVLLFLHRNRRDELETTALGSGKFRIVRSSRGRRFAVRNLVDAHVLHAAGTRLVPAGSSEMRVLDDLLRDIAASAAVAGSRPQPAPQVAQGSRWQPHFTFSGPPLGRRFEPDTGDPIAYTLSTTTDAALGVAASLESADAALAAWSSVPCTSLRLVDGGRAEPARFTQCDGQNQIGFEDPFDEIDDPAGCTGVLAVGGFCADTSAPLNAVGESFFRVTEGDVTVNNGFGGCDFWTASNVAEVLTHELGHTVGLGHSSEDPNEPDFSLRDATMYYAAHFDGRGAALRSDDVAAICALYPQGGIGSLTVRRFAVTAYETDAAVRDRLVVEGAFTSNIAPFDPQADTLIIELHSGGTTLFRLAVLPQQWMRDSSGLRYRYHDVSESGAVSAMISTASDQTLSFSLRARGLDMSGMQDGNAVLSVGMGAANGSQPVPPLRSAAHSRVYP